MTNLASSVENMRSLTRIFPHLGKDLSNSLPTNFERNFNALVMSPNDATIDLFHSDISSSSSSISRSGMGQFLLIFFFRFEKFEFCDVFNADHLFPNFQIQMTNIV